MDYYNVSQEEALQALVSDPSRGLSKEECQRRRGQYGRNELQTAKGPGILRRFFSQFQDFMVIILLAAAAVSFAVSWAQNNGEYVDSLIILAIVVVNAVIGTVQELRADRAIEALKKLSSPHAQVLRDGKRQRVESWELVPGDLVILQAGDLVPADLRLLRSVELKIEESALTGESLPAEKDASAKCPPNAPLGERKNMAFASTGVSSGAGVGVVTATGMDTAMGQIAKMLESEKAPQTPLQQKLKQTGKVLGAGVVLICGIIFLLGVLQRRPPLEMFMIAISLGVAAIPEGLTAVVTIVLAMGIKRMAQKKAIVRHLPAVETLGSTQVICSDKTGTLTQNKMTVVAYSGPGGEERLESSAARFALELSCLCNDSQRVGGTFTGDPTEIAFLRACGREKGALEEEFPRVGEIPFTSARKRMATAHKRPQGGYRVIVKGAPDVLLARCTAYLQGGRALALSGAMKAKLLSDNAALGDRALRVLAVAYKDVESLSSDDNETESNLVFCGLLAMEDPPRPGVKEAVAQCKKAGILPVMITGDHAATALAIGKRLGMAESPSQVITGKELDCLDDGDLSQKIFDYRIFARVSPEHKVKIVKAFQRRGMVVAMTGDGVNDAPALKTADIGCAMGKNGTEVARSAADMVLTDDNFSTIVAAVRQGRGIYQNIRKTIHFLLSCNMGEILVVFVAFLLRVPTPLLAIQLLWVNLVTDSLPALALGADPIQKDVMDAPPHKKEDGILSGGMGYSVAVEGCLVGALALLAYTVGRVFFDLDPAQPVIGRTMAFTVLSLSQLTHSFNMRSEHSVLRLGLFSNKKLVLACGVCAFLMVSVVLFPPLAALFQTTALTGFQWLVVGVLSLCPLLVVEGEKILWSKWGKRR